MVAHENSDLDFFEILGLRPLGQRIRESILSIRGDAYTPPSRFGVSSLKILRPWLALQLWLGRQPTGRRVPLYNLFNRTPTPVADGWSVRKTHVRDFRGGTMTYDSHNGTDFAVPPGTVVVAPAAARVVLVVNEFHRGGLKVMLDHGAGLTTTMGHLGRALVREGDVVPRGGPVALSGASGINFVGALLTDPPHVHMNCWLDGVPVDPFAAPGEISLWRTGDNAPRAYSVASGDTPEPLPSAADFDAVSVERWISACRDPDLATRLDVADLTVRACRTIFYANYYPTRFSARENPYTGAHARTPRLDLPFRAEDYDGVAW